MNSNHHPQSRDGSFGSLDCRDDHDSFIFIEVVLLSFDVLYPLFHSKVLKFHIFIKSF